MDIWNGSAAFGHWKTGEVSTKWSTEKVLRVLEQAEDYIKFETERFCYCIEYHIAEENAAAMAA